MRKILIRALIVPVILVWASSTNAQTVYNFNDGLAAAKSQGKKVIVNIYSDSDKWCSKMESEVYGNAEVQDLMSSYIYIKLNASGGENYSYKGKKYSASELAKVLGLTSYPTHTFLMPGGDVIKFMYNGVESTSIPGYVDAGDFKSILIYFRDGKYSDTDLSTVL